MLLAVLLAAAALSGCESSDNGQIASAITGGVPGPQGDKAADGGQLWFIPTPVSGLLARATLFTPPGKGPFPLAVIAHGSEQDALTRASAPLPAYPAVTQWLLGQGFAVLVPERPGHGKTGGPYLEDQGACAAADYVTAGNGAADSIATAVKYVTAQPGIRRDGVLLVGNSAGAWGELALVARNPVGVRAVIDFAGGRGGHNDDRPLNNCSPDRLVSAAAIFGKTTRVPTLWLYAENDTYFPPALSQRLADAFRQAGGNVEYHLLPAIPGEGHGLIMTSGASAPWTPYVDAFLKAHR